MGLEMVELALQIEEEFDIYISDTTLEQMKTPKDIADFIGDEYLLNRYTSSSQVGFYRVRKLLVDEFNLNPKAIKPTTTLDTLFKDNTQERWKRLTSILDEGFIDYPLELNPSISWMGFIFMVAMFQFLTIDFTTGEKLLSFILTIPLYVTLLIMLRAKFGSKIPSELREVSSLIKFLGESDSATKYTHSVSIMEKVIELSAKQFGVETYEISYHTKFIELGA